MAKTLLPDRPSAKENRRARIISEAHRMIGRDGFDGLSLRKLAAAAGVTVPTIYNLIGSKEQILVELFRAWIVQVEAAMDQIEADQPLEIAESIITTAIELIREDEVFFRAAHLAMDRLIEARGVGVNFQNLGQKAGDMQTRAVRAAQEQGLLRGDIPAETLGRHIYFTYSEASRSWTYGFSDLETFCDVALTGVYLHFLSDAVEAFRPELLKRLRRVQS